MNKVQHLGGKWSPTIGDVERPKWRKTKSLLAADNVLQTSCPLPDNGILLNGHGCTTSALPCQPPKTTTSSVTSSSCFIVFPIAYDEKH